MKPIGSLIASASVSLPMEDVRPERGISPHLVAEFVAARYNFRVRPQAGTARGITVTLPAGAGAMVPSIVAPTSVATLTAVGTPISTLGTTPFGIPTALPGAIQTAISFRNGTFEIDNQVLAIQQMEFDMAGDPPSVTVQAAATNIGDIVIDDLFQVLEKDFGFRNLASVKGREYQSNVVVEFAMGVEERIKELKALQEIINAALGKESVQLGFERITFGADLTRVPVTKLTSVQGVHGFVLERRANHAFSENRYFSSAPLKTETHFEVLKKIGSLIEGT